MLASYVSSRTLVPALAKSWLRKHADRDGMKSRNLFARWQAEFERSFEHARRRYKALLEAALSRSPGVAQ